MNKLVLKHRHYLISLALAASVISSPIGAFLLRFDFSFPEKQTSQVLWAILLGLAIKMTVFYGFLLHRGWWSDLGIPDLKRIAVANVVASICASIAIFALFGTAYPRSIYVIDLLLTFLIICAIRLGVRLYQEHENATKDQHLKKVLIYGAGTASASLIREIGANPKLAFQIVGLIDDDLRKQKEMLLGLKILGTGSDLPRILDHLKRRRIHVEHILIAIPSASGRQMRQVITHCRDVGLACKTLPAIGDLLTDKGLSTQIRDIALEDLLGRDPVELDEAQIRSMIVSSRVLVTGAAGSIGSELCRQIASFEPQKLILLDQSESDLFRIDMSLRNKFPTVNLATELGDIRDSFRVDEVMRKHAVNSVFHAAAYKHVPLMEFHPLEAARNNIIGTWNVAQAALDHNVNTFVMISSDKAVNPTNVMGATKRAAELLVSSFAGRGSTRFVSVRFGNVLGSNGSVVPIFQSQIADRGPVTVTHPDVRRYFMTVKESVQLVLQASTMGKGSEIFVLDMGDPVRIADLARNMIRLAGFVPDRDIQITFTGLRPGEKLYEELITEGENIKPTHHKKIKIFQSVSVRSEVIENWVLELQLILNRRDEASLILHLSDLIPEYNTPSPAASHVSAVHQIDPSATPLPASRASNGRSRRSNASGGI